MGGDIDRLLKGGVGVGGRSVSSRVISGRGNPVGGAKRGNFKPAKQNHSGAKEARKTYFWD